MASEKGIDVEHDVRIHLENKKVSRHFFWFLWFAYVAVYMTKSCFSGALSSIVTEGVLTKSQTGFITAMFYVVYAPLQVVGGMVADRYSPERLIKIGLIGASIANTVIFLNQNYYVMLIAWVFNGIIQFGIWPGIFKIVSSQLVSSDRKMMSYYLSFSTTGGLILAYLMAAVVPHWKYNFAFSAILPIAFAIGLHFYEKHINPYMKWDRLQNVELPKEPENRVYHIKTSEVFLKCGFLFVTVSVFFSTVVNQSAKSLASIMFVENYDNVSPSIGNMLTIVLLIAVIVGTVIAGRLAKKIKNELLATALFFAFKVPFIALCSFVGKFSIPTIVLCLCLSAVVESIEVLLRNNYTMTFVKYGKAGTAAGILNGAMAASFFVSSYLIPLMIEKTSWQISILFWAALIFVALILLLVAAGKHKKFEKISQ